ncbi:YppG family protein [Gracilibacillus timonensis]|uniref:YppG family protein n=1 Tax=Gracilibacillus timonensis TaxID=1816696 RepID=UPI000826836B|nr:YppG family protein [Gracilibacillus timonensis]
MDYYRYNNEYPTYMPNQPEWPVHQPQAYTSPLPMTPFQYYQKPTIPNPYQGWQSTNTAASGKQSNAMLQYFQDKNGEMDFDKVFHTVNQLASTYQQVSPLVKNMGTWLKAFQK